MGCPCGQPIRVATTTANYGSEQVLNKPARKCSIGFRVLHRRHKIYLTAQSDGSTIVICTTVRKTFDHRRRTMSGMISATTVRGTILPDHRTYAFGIGTSPVAPNCWIKTPAVERLAYHVEFEGRNTAASIFPSPSKSPGVGISVDDPNGKA